MKLDNHRIMRLFAMFADLPDDGIVSWYPIVDSAGEQIISALKLNVDINRNMERLCNAAAACAYYDYTIAVSNRAEAPDEIRVGDISLKSSDTVHGAAVIRDEFMAKIADLIEIPTGFVFKATEASL